MFHMKSEKKIDETVSEDVETNLAEVIRHWDDVQSDERQRFDQSCERFRKEADEITEAAAATERLNTGDFAFRINATR